MVKKVMIIGASGLLGSALTELYLENNDVVIAVGRSEQKPIFTTRHDKYEYVSYDINEDGWGLYSYQDHFASTDILINAVGKSQLSRCDEYSPNDMEKLMRINLLYPYRNIQMYLRDRCSPDLDTKGVVINIGSMAHKYALRYQLPYCMAKAGLVMMTKQMAREHATMFPNITYYCVSPCSFGDPKDKNIGGIIGRILPSMVEIRHFKDKKKALDYYIQSPTGELADVRDVARFIFDLSLKPNKHMSGTNFEFQDCMP